MLVKASSTAWQRAGPFAAVELRSIAAMPARSFLGVICDLNQLLNSAIQDLLNEVPVRHKCWWTAASHALCRIQMRAIDPCCCNATCPKLSALSPAA